MIVAAAPEALTPARKRPRTVYEARGLVRTYAGPRESLRRPPAQLQALRGVSLAIAAGETLGIVGESGSGKSTLVRILLALDQPQAGVVEYEGEQVSGLAESRLRRLRREVQVVFQDPASSLDPRMRVGDTVAEPLRSLRVAGDQQARVAEVLAAVGLEADAARRYPHQFSGGQRQRIAIARALAPGPRVLFADEPVSALDVSVRAQILNLLRDLKQRLDLTLVLVSHDLSVVRHVCDQVMVMYLGRVVEAGPTGDVFASPQHPYTRLLLESAPTLSGPPPRPMPGQAPSASDVPGGCAFHPRCPLAFDRCLAEDPGLLAGAGVTSRAAACHLAFTGRVDRL